jgi:hypothetical protein
MKQGASVIGSTLVAGFFSTWPEFGTRSDHMGFVHKLSGNGAGLGDRGTGEIRALERADVQPQTELVRPQSILY